MKLPVPSLFSKKSPSNYYLALLLRDDKAAAVILKEGGGKLEIVGQNETAFSTPLEEIDLDELLDTLDKTISKAENSLPPNIETEKTVFGVKESWVEEKKIKKTISLSSKRFVIHFPWSRSALWSSVRQSLTY